MRQVAIKLSSILVQPLVKLRAGVRAPVFHALQEAMRVRPVAATGSTRYIKRDMTVGGYYLPKGTMVDVPFYAVSHLATLYHQAQVTGHASGLQGEQRACSLAAHAFPWAWRKERLRAI